MESDNFPAATRRIY